MSGPLRLQAGTTRRLRWVSSGASPTSIFATVWSGSETAVATYAATSSGNGHYYADIPIPATPGFYVAAWTVVNNSLTYENRTQFKSVTTEVD